MLYRYARLKINGVRNGTSASLLKMEFYQNNNNVFPIPGITDVTSSVQFVTNHGPNTLIDENDSTYYLTENFLPGMYLTFDFGSALLDLSSYPNWRWYTGDSADSADPISFDLELSVDGATYYTVVSETNANITQSRKAVAYTVSITDPASGNINSLIYTGKSLIIKRIVDFINFIAGSQGVADYTGATALTPGVHGLLPAAAAGDQDKFFKGDGTWANVGGTGGVNVNIVKVYEGNIQISTGGTTLQVSLPNDFSVSLGVHIGTAWPMATWSNGAVVSISQDTTFTGNNNVNLTTTYTQNYIINLYLVYIPT